jgi:hypothetical protein
MKSHAVLVSSPPHSRPLRQDDRRISISRFIAWQRRVPLASTAVLVRLVRILAR